MKKMMVLLASLLVLTACAQPKKDTKESTTSKTEQSTKASSSAKEKKGLKFVVAPQFEGKTSDLMELGKKLVKEPSGSWRTWGYHCVLYREYLHCRATGICSIYVGQ